jgi:C4-dicarboxylate transporter DctM subunit
LTVTIVMIAFILLLLIGVRVFVAIGLAAALGLTMLLGPEQAMRDVASFLWQSTAIYEFVAIPLFVFTGVLMEATGLGADLLEFCNALVGRVPNALAVAVVITSALFASICGSSVANAATLSLVAVPLLAKEGYPPSMRGGVVAAGGTLGLLIPPSIPLIIYGVDGHPDRTTLFGRHRARGDHGRVIRFLPHRDRTPARAPDRPAGNRLSRRHAARAARRRRRRC